MSSIKRYLEDVATKISEKHNISWDLANDIVMDLIDEPLFDEVKEPSFSEIAKRLGIAESKLRCDAISIGTIPVEYTYYKTLLEKAEKFDKIMDYISSKEGKNADEQG